MDANYANAFRNVYVDVSKKYGKKYAKYYMAYCLVDIRYDKEKNVLKKAILNLKEEALYLLLQLMK